MFTRNDLIDIFLRHLSAASPAAPGDAHKERSPERLLPSGRVFLSEHEIKKMLTPQAQLLKIPREAIISPAAVDWLILRGIKIVRE